MAGLRNTLSRGLSSPPEVRSAAEESIVGNSPQWRAPVETNVDDHLSKPEAVVKEAPGGGSLKFPQGRLDNTLGGRR